MGAGRKTSTYDVDTKAESEHAKWKFENEQRLLGEKLGGVIFGTTPDHKQILDAADNIGYMLWPYNVIGLIFWQLLTGSRMCSAVCNNDTYQECVDGNTSFCAFLP